MHIAIVERDPAVAEMLAFAARRRGHQVVCLADTTRLFGQLPFTPSVAVVGVGDIDDRVLSGVAQIHDAYPDLTVFLTAEHTRQPFAVRALEAGAHDIVRLPYDPVELLAKAEAWSASRTTSPRAEDTVRVADLEVDLSRYSARKNGCTISLTKLELRLLYCLCEHHPHLTSTERLLTFGWEGSLEADPALIKTHISHIRAKLRAAGGIEIQIRSRQSLGYELLTPD